jgi:putative chitobiose transport system permease protein
MTAQLQTRRFRLTPELRKTTENIVWYIVLCLVAILTVFPFVWVFFTSFKGPNDAVHSVPPQLIPQEPTFANYLRVWDQLPVGLFFSNSILVAVITVVVNLLFTSLAAYAFAKMNFWGRDVIFYLLLATFIVPRNSASRLSWRSMSFTTTTRLWH